ncbi:fatty acid desaturase family protein [Solimicrobium silvestre]|uniref:Fatty acid desaturase n=1 Tax=Solimicrobium silvestre TaxID=2099400 RepID=A0A2S9GWH2_9BURK|nr:fatty acid desaturase family protein [Solimicrobium silvestre]PRC92006.1 Fatty acid desaturase [Solimicrobium silvestre]
MSQINPAPVKPTSAMRNSVKLKLRDIFSAEEISQLTARSDLMGWSAVLFTWGVIALVFVALAVWPHPLMWCIAFIILGGRQLSLAIMMHDASHGTLFKTKWLNDVLADYVCGSPVGVDIKQYRQHHLTHHIKTGTDADTDKSLSAPFPTSRSSLLRKFARDLSGISGIKREFGLLLMNAGVIRWTVASDIAKLPQEGRTWRDYAQSIARNSWKNVAFHLLLITLLTVAGYPWLYLAWLGAYLTTYSLFMRIRSIAEHACTEASTDMFLNTRSTRAGLLARATVAPLRVNHHIEHHLMASVPYFKLPAMHQMLRERGYLAAPPGYMDVLKLASTPS